MGLVARGESLGRTTTYGSRISTTVSNGPSPTGSITNVKSSSPRSTSSRRPPSSAGLGELDRDVGPRGRELAQEAREHPCAHALVRADAQRAGRALGERGHVGLGRLEARDDPGCVAEQELPGLRERDAAGAAGSLDELRADDALERLDLLADRGLRVAEPRGGAPERPFVGDRLEGSQMPDLDPEPTISSHDRFE